MRKALGVLIFALLLSSLLIGCSNTQEKPAANPSSQVESRELMVSAAASLTESLTELQKVYAQKKPEVKITFNFGGSGALQQQIEQGAPVDLFISAGKSQIDALDKKTLLVKESLTNLLGNDLVLVVNSNSGDSIVLGDLTKPDFQKIALGTPESVPAGKYAQEALKNLNLWDPLQSKFVFAKDVKQVLHYVETGNAEAGFVYKSDVQGSTKAKISQVVPSDVHLQILYPAAIVAATKNKQDAEEFLNFLKGSEAQQLFEKYGFKPLKK